MESIEKVDEKFRKDFERGREAVNTLATILEPTGLRRDDSYDYSYHEGADYLFITCRTIKTLEESLAMAESVLGKSKGPRVFVNYDGNISASFGFENVDCLLFQFVAPASEFPLERFKPGSRLEFENKKEFRIVSADEIEIGYKMR